eukprot:6548252-Pyramimonas_sp.AAC.1
MSYASWRKLYQCGVTSELVVATTASCTRTRTVPIWTSAFRRFVGREASSCYFIAGAQPEFAK